MRRRATAADDGHRPPGGPHVIDGGRAGELDDPRVLAVLAVLGGTRTAEVAAVHGVPVSLLHRWVGAFVAAGTAQITNSPDPAAGAQRDRFLASFAHEVRSPLTVALGWAGVLAEGDLPPEMLPTAVERLAEALERLNQTTLDIELLTAASLGRLPVDRRVLSVGRLAAGFGSGAVLGAGPELELISDPALAHRVLRDVWRAAYTRPEPRSVHLESALVGTFTEIAVVRVGDPIEPPVLQALFEPFDANDDATGITMGLYLARALVVALGGTLGMDQGPESGRLWLRLPTR